MGLAGEGEGNGDFDVDLRSASGGMNLLWRADG